MNDSNFCKPLSYTFEIRIKDDNFNDISRDWYMTLIYNNILFTDLAKSGGPTDLSAAFPPGPGGGGGAGPTCPTV